MGGELASAARTRFDRWLRTGIMPGADNPETEFKYNHNHDPADGRFSSGIGGAALGRAAGRSGSARQRGDQAIDLKPISAADQAVVHGIAATPSVMHAMQDAWDRTLKTGDEHGFMIYTDGRSYSAGPMQSGSEHELPALVNQRSGADPRKGLFNYAVAWFHTHPGDYPEAWRATSDDQTFGTAKTSITIVKTRKGFVVGR